MYTDFKEHKLYVQKDEYNDSGYYIYILKKYPVTNTGDLWEDIPAYDYISLRHKGGSLGWEVFVHFKHLPETHDSINNTERFVQDDSYLDWFREEINKEMKYRHLEYIALLSGLSGFNAWEIFNKTIDKQMKYINEKIDNNLTKPWTFREFISGLYKGKK